MPAPCLMIDWCLHLLDVMFCLSCLLDELLMLDCMCYVHETKAWSESTAWWWPKPKSFFLILSFCQFFSVFVAHDFLDPPTWLSGFFHRLKVLQSDWSVGLANPTLPPPSSNQVRTWGVKHSKTGNKRTTQKLSMCKVDPVSLLSFARSWFCDRIR